MRYNRNTLAIRLKSKVSPTVGHQIATLRKTVNDTNLHKVASLVPTCTSLAIYCSYAIVSTGTLRQRLQQLLSDLSITKRSQQQIFQLPIYCNNSCKPSLSFIYRRDNLSTRRIVTLRDTPSCLVCVLNFLPNFTCLKKLSPQLRAPQLSDPHAYVPTNDIKVNNTRAKICPLTSPNN